MVLGLNPKSLISNKDRKHPPRCWAGSSFLAPALSTLSHLAKHTHLGHRCAWAPCSSPRPEGGLKSSLSIPVIPFPSLTTRSSLQNSSPCSWSAPPPRGLQPWLATPGAATIQIIQVIIFNNREKNGEKKK